jgi:hypothetical protein
LGRSCARPGRGGREPIEMTLTLGNVCYALNFEHGANHFNAG